MSALDPEQRWSWWMFLTSVLLPVALGLIALLSTPLPRDARKR